MSISEDRAEIEAVKELLNEAWDKASEAKEQVQEAREKLAALGGTEPPELIEQSIAMCDESYGQLEQGQGLMSATQTRLGEFAEKLT